MKSSAVDPAFIEAHAYDVKGTVLPGVTEPPPAEKKSKYNNKPFTDSEGVRWDSQAEFRMWLKLLALSAGGVVQNLRRQVPFDLTAHGVLVGRLVLDFVYETEGRTAYADVKSKPTITPLFKWKARHFKAQYGVEVELLF